jgi:catechol 2,3-dioxygenase
MSPVLPASIHLGAVRLRVADRARTAAWYERALSCVPQPGHGDVLGLGPAEGPTLVELREVPGARAMPPRGRVGLYHHALLLPSRADLGALLRHLRAIGEPVGASDHLFSEALYLTDPDGMTVEVYADTPRETWTWEGGEVLGAVDPLDEAAVAAAATGPWRGLPRGTVLGHVHFFVSDLAVAERFHVDTIGFAPVTRRFRGALFVSAGDYHHHVGLNVWAAREPIAGPDDVGLDHWTLVLPDATSLTSLAERLRQQGHPVHLTNGSLTVRDPWGMTLHAVVGEG